MAYYVHITEDCQREAIRHGYIQELENFKKKLEHDQNTSLLENYLPTPFLKKRFGKFKLFVKKTGIDNDIIISFIKIIPRGAKEYSEKPKEWIIENGNRYSPSKNEINTFYKEEKFKGDINNPPEVSEIEKQYLYHGINHIDKNLLKDGYIYESLSWVELINHQEICKYCLDFQKALLNIIDSGGLNEIEYKTSYPDVLIILKYFPLRKMLFLIAPITSHNIEEKERYKEKYCEIIEANTISEKEIKKLSRRSYPAMIVCDEKLWMRIEEKKEGNLSLSPEESQILESVLYPKQNDKIYPLFINGRPGSGKSTILQYIFASHLYMHFSKAPEERLSNPPLYLTYSEKLLNNAKDAVRSILDSNIQIQSATTTVDINTTENKNTFNKSFSLFHEYLYKLLSNDKKAIYDPEKHLDFGKFKKLWCNAMTKHPDKEVRELNPELVWHVIRTFIKGMALDIHEYLEPDDYFGLPSKQKTVTQKVYETIFAKTWKKWYSDICTQQGYWDDQDLALELLNQDVKRYSKHPCVFCDEAQDFTKNELEIISRLSIYSNRNVDTNDLKRIPMAFAGDPFQTLNPTGFSWEAVLANFHEKLIQQFDKRVDPKLELNYNELSFNYRSTDKIVRFCNMIQLIRGIIFNIKELVPQETYFDEKSASPVYFDINSSICLEKLKENINNITIIIPCQDSERVDYIASEQFLSNLQKYGENINPIITPMSAKGLEFSRVVLYKFGDEYVKKYSALFQSLNTGESLSEDSPDIIPYEYFINRLYVAASRAKKRIIILDTLEGINKLWNNYKLLDPNKLIEIYKSKGRVEWKRKSLPEPFLAYEGDEQSWIGDEDNPIELANQFKDAGISEMSSYFLSLAASKFRIIGKNSDALNCDAIRLKIEDKIKEAAIVYLELKDKSKAIKLLWDAEEYKEILKYNEFQNTLEHKASYYLTSEINQSNIEAMIDFISMELKGERKNMLLSGSRWNVILRNRIQELFNFTINPEHWKKIEEKIKEIESEGLSIPNELQAEIAFRAYNYGVAAEIWEQLPIPKKTTRDYYLAKSKSTPYPNNLFYLSKNSNFKDIISIWDKNRYKLLDKEPLDYVYSAILEQEEYKKLIELAFINNRPDFIIDNFSKIKNSKDPDVIKEAVFSLLDTYMKESENFQDAVKLVRDLDVHKREALSYFIYKCSISDVLTSADGRIKKLIYEFINRNIRQINKISDLNVKVIGSAIERAGMHINGLEYYETVWKSIDDTHGKIKYKSKDITYARKRWLKVKHKYANFLPDKHLAKKQFDEFNMYIKEWSSISHKDIDDLPLDPYISSEYDPSRINKRRVLGIISYDDKSFIKSLYKDGHIPEKIAIRLGLDIEDVEGYIKSVK